MEFTVLLNEVWFISKIIKHYRVPGTVLGVTVDSEQNTIQVQSIRTRCSRKSHADCVEYRSYRSMGSMDRSLSQGVGHQGRLHEGGDT